MKKLIIAILLIISMKLSAQEVDFLLPDINSTEYSFEDLKGDKITLIDFWATWCKPCSQLMPKLNDFEAKWTDELKIIGISIDGPRSMIKVKPFINTMGVKYPVLLDPDQELSGDLNINSIPTLILVNNDGEILWTHEGYALGDEKKIEEKIEYYLNK